MERFRHEKYEVWHRSINYAVIIYGLAQNFPAVEKYGLADQLRRAAVSIPSNIAEGSGRGSDLEFARFLGVAYGSLMEVLTQLEIAYRVRYLNEKQIKMLRAEATEISKMLSGLRKVLKRK